MIKKTIDFINKYKMINTNDHIVVGVSGGPDSICLLHILLEYKKQIEFDITVVHINHGIRGEESDGDENFVKLLCKENNIIFKAYYCNLKLLKDELKTTEENAGRMFRYNSFASEFKENKINKIAVAHNMDDQGETLLLKLFRGAGIQGLGAMSPNKDNIIRPILSSTKKEILYFLNSNNFEYRIDRTNLTTDYNRNKIRLEYIPKIQDDFNKKIINTLYTTSEIIREENNFIDKIAIEHFNTYTINTDEVIFNINKFCTEDKVIQRRLIRLAYKHINGHLIDLTAQHIDSILNLIQNKNTGKKINLPYDSMAIINYEDIHIKKNTDIQDFKYKIVLDEEIYVKEKNIFLLATENPNKYHNINLKCTKIFNYDIIKHELCIRNRCNGDKIFIENVGHKKLKNYFIDKKINRENRNSIPLLCIEDKVIWIIDNYVDKNFIPNESDKKIYILIWEL